MVRPLVSPCTTKEDIMRILLLITVMLGGCATVG